MCAYSLRMDLSVLNGNLESAGDRGSKVSSWKSLFALATDWLKRGNPFSGPRNVSDLRTAPPIICI